jgi:hypothetical protein
MHEYNLLDLYIIFVGRIKCVGCIALSLKGEYIGGTILGGQVAST